MKPTKKIQALIKSLAVREYYLTEKYDLYGLGWGELGWGGCSRMED